MISNLSLFSSTRNTLWSVYLLAMIIAGVLGVISALRGLGSVPISLIQLLFTCGYSVGVIGYVLKMRIGTSNVWSIVLYIATFGTALTMVNLLWSYGLIIAGAAIMLTIAACPMLYGLRAYQSPAQPWWNDLTAYQHQRLVDEIDLDDGEIVLTATHQQDDGIEKEFVVKLKEVLDQYVVALKITCGDKQESFHNEFWSLHAALKFVEQQTPLRVQDFVCASSRRNPQR